jgi:hypothetical protein
MFSAVRIAINYEHVILNVVLMVAQKPYYKRASQAKEVSFYNKFLRVIPHWRSE